MATETPTPIPPPTTSHLSFLAAAIESGDRAVLGRTLDEMAAELFVLSERTSGREIWPFVGMLYEIVYGEARDLLDPPKPKSRRRWFR